MSGLLVGEIALSVILLASAGLLIRSARALYAADQAIDVSNLVTARLSLPPGQYGTPQERIAFYEQLELRLASIPSIASAAIGTALPFFGATRRDVALDSDLEAAAAGTRSAQTLAIGSRYFETLGLSLQRGRSFDARDGLPGQETVIVNERFVTDVFAGAGCDWTTHPSDRQRLDPCLIGPADHRRHRTDGSAYPCQRTRALLSTCRVVPSRPRPWR